MMERRLKIGLALLLTLCLAIPASMALADREDALEMQIYWQLVGDMTRTDPLTRAMNGDVALTLAELKAVTAEDLLAFAAENKLPVSMARHAWYTALADRLAAELPQSATGERLALFLAMGQNARDNAANEQRRAIRKAMTEADINGYATETGLPAGFLAWLILDDEWYEPEWDDGDDWREGRRSWNFSDWVDAADLQAKYGREAVVTDDDVERVLRQNGYRFDD
ncbi:MAG: hypothetical protein E7318_10210 [Clostridiales bacterium]|nr:hypothetical protein [Clostridiales bacterium]